MRISGFIIIWALLFYSCREVSFKIAQPAGVSALNEVPATLQGRYHTIDPSGSDKRDTLIIESWGYHFKDRHEKDWLGRGVISDSLVVKFYQDYYFINFRSGDQWVLRLIKQKPSGDIEFLSIDLSVESDRKEILKKISKKISMIEIKRDDDTFYQINPTPAQLMTLVKEGYFTGIPMKKVK
jgi:hypothetical protein